jgi:hypothetical protein
MAHFHFDCFKSQSQFFKTATTPLRNISTSSKRTTQLGCSMKKEGNEAFPRVSGLHLETGKYFSG